MEKLTFDQLPALLGDVCERLDALTEEVRAIKPVPPEERKDGYLSRKEVCSYLGISLPTLHKVMKAGTVKAYHIGGRTLFKRNEVEQALQPVSYDLTKRSNAGRKPKPNH
jgi:excisionase family DNA binding protein